MDDWLWLVADIHVRRQDALPFSQALDSVPRDHHSVVCAEFGRRAEQLESCRLGDDAQRLTDVLVACNSSGEHLQRRPSFSQFCLILGMKQKSLYFCGLVKQSEGIHSQVWDCSLAAGPLLCRTRWRDVCALQGDWQPCAASLLRCHSHMTTVFPVLLLQRDTQRQTQVEKQHI